MAYPTGKPFLLYTPVEVNEKLTEMAQAWHKRSIYKWQALLSLIVSMPIAFSRLKKKHQNQQEKWNKQNQSFENDCKGGAKEK